MYTSTAPSRGLNEVAKEAHIVATAIGRRQQFTVGPDMVKAGAVVVDVGTSSANGKIMGDVRFDLESGLLRDTRAGRSRTNDHSSTPIQYAGRRGGAKERPA